MDKFLEEKIAAIFAATLIGIYALFSILAPATVITMVACKKNETTFSAAPTVPMPEVSNENAQ